MMMMMMMKIKMTTMLMMVVMMVGATALQWSSVGDIPVSLLSSGIQMLVNALVPMANTYLATGYPLPTLPGLTLVDPTIGYGADYMFVATSITYQPPIGAVSFTKPAAAPARGPVAIAIN